MQGTSKEEKNDLLFGNFEINYQKLNPMFRQGSCILKTEVIFQFCSELYRTDLGNQTFHFCF